MHVLEADADSGTSEFLPSLLQRPTPTLGTRYQQADIFALSLNYVAHETCAMCPMAILLSRIGRIVFGERLQLTGGIAVGLTKTVTQFWSSELQTLLAPGTELEATRRVAVAERSNSAQQSKCACVVLYV